MLDAREVAVAGKHAAVALRQDALQVDVCSAAWFRAIITCCCCRLPSALLWHEGVSDVEPASCMPDQTPQCACVKSGHWSLDP